MPKILKYQAISDLAKDLRSNQPNLEDISDNRIGEIVRYLAWEKDDVNRFAIHTHDDLLYEIIKLIKCDLNRAKQIVDRMKELGLEVCVDKDTPLHPGTGYNLLRFANMRGYVTDQEIEKREEELEEQARVQEEYEERMTMKYGSDPEKWPDDDEED